MGKLNINNQETNDSDFFCPQHSADFTKQSTFKSGENCALTNSDSTSSFLKKGLTIFHQNIRGL